MVTYCRLRPASLHPQPLKLPFCLKISFPQTLPTPSGRAVHGPRNLSLFLSPAPQPTTSPSDTEIPFTTTTPTLANHRGPICVGTLQGHYRGPMWYLCAN